MTNVLIIEEDPLERRAIIEIIQAHQNTIIPFEFEDPHLAIEKIRLNEIEVDLIITALELENVDGSAIVQLIAELTPQTPVIVMSNIDKVFSVKNALGKGARGYLLKNSRRSELLFAISYINDGGSYVSADIAIKSLKSNVQINEYNSFIQSSIKLSKVEKQVIEGVANGLTNSEIGEKLFMGKRTIEGIRGKLLIKTKTPNSAALVSYAFRNGYIN
ncbi:response regulator transcription factor [Pedobacter mucosus]|uniref:response regulator transcription factor n=1 Tax=Pedobacter mucosus TaxID=2895286 RepID=UPI001EE3CF14|nr:response regulator transcription factor [Pedobacter mucosus]UKT65836.1 response regulator transcription factor [Pedobacter mucosus]